MTATVIVMAKAPRAGLIKTRLEPLLGPAGCAKLQAGLTRHVTHLATGAGYRTAVAVTPGDALSDVLPLLPSDQCLVMPQRGRDLGQRMSAAVDDAFAAGATSVVVVGTDLPTLTAAALQEAFAALTATDLVLGPAVDGGYWLIGMRRPRPDVFGIDPELWGGPRVLAATLDLATALGLAVHLLPEDRDLDSPDDAAVLLDDPRLPAAVRELLRSAGVPA